jgi:4-amino-4-deoxy-L-arabinose transferase-like glycosyltransferase
MTARPAGAAHGAGALMRTADGRPIPPAAAGEPPAAATPARLYARPAVGTGKEDAIIALLLALLTAVFLTSTASDIGLTWDEPIYIEAAKSYVAWFGELITRPLDALSNSGIDRFWGLNHEHPPVDKVWSGLVWSVARYFLSDIPAHRLGNILLVALLVALLYRMVADQYGREAGLFAAGALMSMPRFFFHAHLAALDIPAAVLTFAVTFVFWRAQDRPGASGTLLLGLVLGLALGTKLSTIICVPTLIVYTLIFKRRLYLLIRLGVAAVLATLIWWLSWPWLYHNTLGRAVDFVKFLTVDHYKIAQWYLGRNYLPPPWHFPFMITLAVLPLMLIILALIGTLSGVLGRARRHVQWLFIISAATPIVVMAVDTGAAYDNERLLMASFPYIAALAGVGFYYLLAGVHRVIAHVHASRWAVSLALLAACLALLPQVVAAWDLYPHLLSYYSELVGGLPGAVSLGFETTYWSETYFDALPYLNTNAGPRAIVWAEAHDVMLYYQADGRLRSDLRVASRVGAEGIVPGTQGYSLPVTAANFVVVAYRQSGLSNDLRKVMATGKPVYQLSYQGIPLMEIYKLH